MFGSSDKDQDNEPHADGNQAVEPVMVSPAPDDGSGQPPPPPAMPLITPTVPPLNDAMAPFPSSDTGVPNLPAVDEPKEEDAKVVKKSDKKHQDMPSIVPDSGNEELFDLKQQALQSLAPLVDKLDQTPDEKFKTTMMLIQASDNPSLIKEAYDAANAITDEKTRAQALLDVVNEINYFTQPHDNNSQ